MPTRLARISIVAVPRRLQRVCCESRTFQLCAEVCCRLCDSRHRQPLPSPSIPTLSLPLHSTWNDTKDAIDVYTQALGMCPDHDDGLVARGAAFATTGRLRQAMQDLSRALSLNPQNDNASSYLQETRRWILAFFNLTHFVRVGVLLC